MDALDWLLKSDPSIRWQSMLDLADASPSEVAAERSLVASQGFGARILALQESDGSWRLPQKPIWLPTLYTLLLLRSTGADPASPAIKSAIARLESTLGWSDVEYWELRPLDVGGNTF